MKKLTTVFPEDLFRKAKSELEFTQEPLKDEILRIEQSKSPEILGRALSNDMTRLFFKSLWFKIHQNPPENITLEIKGGTRSSKSTNAIFIYVWLSRAWGYEPVVGNILANQAELLYKLKDSRYGETFIVDEQTPETYSEGIIAETEQLGNNLNICAKKCNNIIFIFPTRFTIRGAPYGLETMGRDVKNKWNKCFLYDLGERRAMGFSNFPMGYVTIPKYVDEKYAFTPQAKWNPARLENYKEKGYDFDSLLEEEYEEKKNEWIEDVRKISGSMRNKIKDKYAYDLSQDLGFTGLTSKTTRMAFVQMKVNRGGFMEMSKNEMETIVGMAEIYLEGGMEKLEDER